MYENQIDIPKTPNTAKSANSDAGDTFMSNFFANDENNLQHTLEINENLKKKEIENEFNDFWKTILEEMFKKESTSTVQFWRKNSIKFPHMSKLALLLLTIQSSSAFIERFFSVCGVVCKPRASNMKDDLIIKRSMLKVNIKILDSLKIEEN
jgi:hypothetical protein